MTCFSDPKAYEVELGEAPKEVDTVMNFRVVNQRTFVAGVSGGVPVQPGELVKRQAIQVESYPHLSETRPSKSPKRQPTDRWWWD